MCVTVSAVEGVDVSGDGGSFRFLRRNIGTSSVYLTTLRLWAAPVLAAKISNQQEIYGPPPPPLRLESYPIFVAGIRVPFEYQRWKRDEVVAKQWGMCYVVQFYVDSSVVRAKSYGTVTVACDGGYSSVRKT